jgi:hypothetical protein
MLLKDWRNEMTRQKILSVAAVTILFATASSVQAWWRVGIGIGIPVYRPYPYRFYVAPAPVYVAPAPVYATPTYVAPPPVYVQPAPQTVQPSPTTTAPAQPERIAPPIPQGLPPQPVPIGNR